MTTTQPVDAETDDSAPASDRDAALAAAAGWIACTVILVLGPLACGFLMHQWETSESEAWALRRRLSEECDRNDRLHAAQWVRCPRCDGKGEIPRQLPDAASK